MDAAWAAFLGALVGGLLGLGAPIVESHLASARYRRASVRLLRDDIYTIQRLTQDTLRDGKWWASSSVVDYPFLADPSRLGEVALVVDGSTWKSVAGCRRNWQIAEEGRRSAAIIGEAMNVHLARLAKEADAARGLLAKYDDDGNMPYKAQRSR